ncbi:MAG: PstS family phosphate ABC transporter substrate-binding protein [Nitrospirota bacterium]
MSQFRSPDPLRRKVFSRLALATAVLGATAWLCEPTWGQERLVVAAAIEPYVPSAELSGRLTIAGSDTMQPLLSRLAAEFMRRHPDVKIGVEGGGSKAALTEFVVGYSLQGRGDKARDGGHQGASKASLLATSRALTPEEIRRFTSKYGYEPLAIPIAMDAVAIFVNKENPIQGLTLAQVDAIFSSARRRGYPSEIAAWGDLGLKGGWERQPIRLYGRNERSATREFFMHAALGDAEIKSEIRVQPGTASLILALAKDPLGIGYAGMGYPSSMVRIVPLAEEDGKPFVEPTVESIADGRYPLSRFLYLYVNKAPDAKFDPVTQEFLKFINSRDGQDVVLRARFFPLTSSQVEKNLALLVGSPVTATLPRSAQ